MYKFFSHKPMCPLYILSSRSLLSLPVGVVSLGEAPVDAVVDGGAVVADGQAGPVAADGVDAEPAALVLAAVALVQIVRAVEDFKIRTLFELKNINGTFITTSFSTKK